MCCTRLAENAGRKKSPSVHHRTTLTFWHYTNQIIIIIIIIISCFIKMWISLTFLEPAYPGCPRNEAVGRLSKTGAKLSKL